MCYEKIGVYHYAKSEDYRSFKIFDFILIYLKDICEVGVIIAFYPNSVSRGFDFRQKCHKSVQIIL